MKKYFKKDQSSVSLSQEIGRGGEGAIFTIEGLPDYVAKIYHQPPSAEHRDKVLAMINNPPVDPSASGPTRHISLVWPKEALYSDRRHAQYAGFLMPRIQISAFSKMITYLTPELRLDAFGGEITWRHLVHTAINLSSCVAAIHEKGHCIGDLNESNFLVSRNTLLCVIDCDSFQIKDPLTGRLWRCPVGKEDYTAPEIASANFRNVDRTVYTDNFALSTMIFQLLMEGTHPYSAKGRLVNDAPRTCDKIAKGIYPYVTRKGIEPPDYAPPFQILHPRIQDLFIRSFVTGHKTPQERPSAEAWMSTLRSIFAELKKCSANQNHYFFPHVPNCPWCERAALFGKDNFQSVIGQQIALVDPGAKTFSDKEKIEYLSQLIEVAISDGSISLHEQAFLISQGRKLQLSESVVRNIIAGATSGTASVQTGRSSRTQTPKSGSRVAPPVVTTQSVPSASQPKGGAAYAVRRFANRALLLIIFIVVPAVLALEKCSG